MKIHGASAHTSGQSLPDFDLHTDAAKVGLWINSRDPAIVEVAAAEAFDWICVDGQHGHAELADYRSLFEAAHAFSIPAAVRVSSHDLGHIGRAVDAGARAIIVPTVENGQQAKTLVDACRFAPRGKRSYGPTRLSPRYPVGVPGTPKSDPLAILMIETAQGLQNLDAILSTQPDGIFVGPYDLALSLGVTLEELTEGSKQHILRDIAQRCSAAGVAPGIFAGSVDLARTMAGIGFNFMPIATDSSLVSTAARQLLEAVTDFRASS